MKALIFAAVGAASVVVLPGLASAQIAPEYYGSLGYNNTKIDDANLGAVQGRLGAKLNKNFGVEAEVAGGVKDDEITVGGVPVKVELQHQAAAYAVGFLPVTPQLDLIARAGYGTTKAKASAVGTGFSDSNESWNYGVGAQYSFDARNGVRADWTKSEYQHSDSDSDTVAVAYVRKF
jgi:outer membrane immunogenic protein